MNALKKIGGFFIFLIGGLVAIVVGSFMIRGTMHMWDKDESNANNSKTKDKDSEKLDSKRKDN